LYADYVLPGGYTPPGVRRCVGACIAAPAPTVPKAGHVVAITGQITLQYSILNDGAPHRQDERDGDDVSLQVK
jgi:hypothetical protein